MPWRPICRRLVFLGVLWAGLGSRPNSDAHAQAPPPASQPASPGYPPQAAPGAPASPYSSGGLAPPPASPRSADSAVTEAKLDRAEREDSGRGLEFVWLNTEFGYQRVDLQTFKANNLVDADLVEETASGFSYGAGIGLRVVFLTAGARFRLATMDAWDLWSLDAELGLRVPLGVLEPYVVLAAGYSSIGNVSLENALNVAADSIDINGFNARLGLGLDWYVTKVFSVGLNLSSEGLFTSRNGSVLVVPEGAPNAQAASVYARDGDGIGFGFGATFVAGLHF